jgi:hypothetical protein
MKLGRFGKPLAMAAFGCAAVVAGAVPAPAADLTYERLLNPEPQNWLTNHHDYTSQRFSALDGINKANVKNLRLLFAIALGGTSTNESLEATPLVEDGFMYMVDSWGVVSRIDVRSGTAGRFLWKMDPKLEKQDRNRGVALWQNLVISVTRRDRVGQEPARPNRPRTHRGAARAQGFHRHRRLRRRPRPAQLGGRARSPDRRDQMEDLFDSSPRRARQRNLEGQSRGLADRRRRLLRHRLL